jgi:hypothetical protein
MQTVVGKLAKDFGISLVLRYESDEIDPANRGDAVNDSPRKEAGQPIHSGLLWLIGVV